MDRGILGTYPILCLKGRGQSAGLTCPGACRCCCRNKHWGTHHKIKRNSIFHFSPYLLKGQHYNQKKTASPHKCYSLYILIYSFVCLFFLPILNVRAIIAEILFCYLIFPVPRAVFGKLKALCNRLLTKLIKEAMEKTPCP